MLARHHTKMMETSPDDGISNYVVLYLSVGVAISLGTILYKLWQSVTCSNRASDLLHYYISTKNPTAVMSDFRHFPVACTTLSFFLSVGNLASVKRHLSNRRLRDT